MTYARAYFAARAVLRHRAALQCARQANADGDSPAARGFLIEAARARQLLANARGHRSCAA